MSDNHALWVFASHHGGRIDAVALELLGKARQLAAQAHAPVEAILAGHEVEPLLDELRSLRVKDLDCRDCEYFPRCKPCIGIAYHEHGRYTARPHEYCRLTAKYLKGKNGP